MTYSERELNLPSRGFTGEEWGNGTAQKFFQRQYKEAVAKKDSGREVPQMAPDWFGQCSVCGQSPTVPETGMCGPCTFGESDTIGGNW